MTLKERIIRYLDRMNESNPKDKEKLKLILNIIDRVFVGIPVRW